MCYTFFGRLITTSYCFFGMSLTNSILTRVDYLQFFRNFNKLREREREREISIFLVEKASVAGVLQSFYCLLVQY